MLWCELPDGMQDYSDLLTLALLDENWNVVESTWPDSRLKGFLYITQAGDYEMVVTLPGEGDVEPVSWVMAGDRWICMDGETPVPDNLLFTYYEDCVYELPTDGLK